MVDWEEKRVSVNIKWRAKDSWKKYLIGAKKVVGYVLIEERKLQKMEMCQSWLGQTKNESVSS